MAALSRPRAVPIVFEYSVHDRGRHSKPIHVGRGIRSAAKGDKATGFVYNRSCCQVCPMVCHRVCRLVV